MKTFRYHNYLPNTKNCAIIYLEGKGKDTVTV